MEGGLEMSGNVVKHYNEDNPDQSDEAEFYRPKRCRSKDNPFYSNHVFKDRDLKRDPFRPTLLERVLLFFRCTYVQLSVDHVFYYKCLGPSYYLIKVTTEEEYEEEIS
jgi:hypothetical protein